MIRLLVVDDHPVVRAGMVAVLGEEPDFEVVGEAGNGAEALALVPRLRPHVVLMDLRMPVMDGAEATARMTTAPDPPQVLVLTTYDTDADIVRAVEAGAAGTCSRTRRPECSPTRSAGPPAARRCWRRRWPRGWPTGCGRRPAPTSPGGSSRCCASSPAACRTPTSARSCSSARRTVKTHLIRAFAKLGVTDRTAAVTAAYADGLIDLPRS